VVDDDVVRVKTDLVLFPVRIRDKQGRATRGLTEANLAVKDPDKVTTGLYLLPGAEHVALLFALDRSASLREIIAQQQEAALSLFGRFSGQSSIAVLRFAGQPSRVTPFNNDILAAREAFSSPATTDQRTAIFDAAQVAVDAFAGQPRKRAERRIVILISDGLDTASTVKPGAVIQSALKKQVSFYVIHLPLFEPREGRLMVRTPARGFRDLGEKTGGRYFLVGNVNTALVPLTRMDLTPVFQAIEEDLKSQYLLGFYLGSAADKANHRSFTMTLVPPGVEYSVNGRSYARTHKFSVDFPGGVTRVDK